MVRVHFGDRCKHDGPLVPKRLGIPVVGAPLRRNPWQFWVGLTVCDLCPPFLGGLENMAAPNVALSSPLASIRWGPTWGTHTIIMLDLPCDLPCFSAFQQMGDQGSSFAHQFWAWLVGFSSSPLACRIQFLVPWLVGFSSSPGLLTGGLVGFSSSPPGL